MNPFDLAGPDFLRLYGTVLCIAAVVAYFVRRSYLAPFNDLNVELDLDAYEMAYLSGGARAAVTAAIASLYQNHLVTIDSKDGGLSVADGQLPARAHFLEWTVYDAAKSSASRSVSSVLTQAAAGVDRIAKRLEEFELVTGAGRGTMARVVPGMVMLAVLGFGAIKLIIGVQRNRPVGFLVLLLLATLAIAIGFFAVPALRTRRGDRLLRAVKAKNAALQTTAKTHYAALAGHDLALAVGLFGIGVMAGGPLDDLRRKLMPQSQTYSDYSTGWSGCGGSSCGGGGCGGGCGGGGCGGCS